MYPAPFKQSNPVGAERPKMMDKNALGRENWTLGASPMFYETINQTNFNKQSNQIDRKAQQAAIFALKSKVGGSSIKNEVKSQEMLGAVWQTNSQYVHKELNDAEPIDPQARNEQRKKLTQSNFGMGKASVGYYTTNKL